MAIRLYSIIIAFYFISPDLISQTGLGIKAGLVISNDRSNDEGFANLTEDLHKSSTAMD